MVLSTNFFIALFLVGIQLVLNNLHVVKRNSQLQGYNTHYLLWNHSTRAFCNYTVEDIFPRAVLDFWSVVLNPGTDRVLKCPSVGPQEAQEDRCKYPFLDAFIFAFLCRYWSLNFSSGASVILHVQLKL
jgi:hypothetical protein